MKRRFVGKKRGAITGDKVKQLCSFLHSKGKGKYAVGVAAAYAALLRHGDLLDLRIRDIVKRGSKYWVAVFGGKGREKEDLEWVEVGDFNNLFETVIEGQDLDDFLACKDTAGNKAE